MKDALELNIHGIKCDNPDCDYNDMTVRVENYDKWLNKPCPKCGENLLTEKDYESVKVIMSLTENINNIFPKRKEEEQIYKASIDMDGSGKMEMKIDK